jgi:hypothetical protein
VRLGHDLVERGGGAGDQQDDVVLLVDHGLNLGDLGGGVAVGVEDLELDLHAEPVQALDLSLDLVLGFRHPRWGGVDRGPPDLQRANVGHCRGRVLGEGAELVIADRRGGSDNRRRAGNERPS